MSGPVIDGCAGPGGWDIAAEALGIRPLGIELDDAACATREAAGLWTLQADVSAVDPREVMREHFGGEQLWGEIFSPPCPSFSMAGKGEGRAVIPLYQDAMVRIAVECKSVDRDELDEICGDPRAHLILEPLRWALALKPAWVALEQVEPCLPLWETTAGCLRHHGYRTWTGVLSAERYGVPQTRRRAILLASLERQPVMPPPSHQRYEPPRKVEEATESLFDVPEPERIVVPEDRGLLPWVSMAEALGWGMTARPSVSVMAQGQTGGPKPLGGGSGADAVLAREQTEGRWHPQDLVGFPRLADTPSNRATGRIELDGTDYRERDLRAASEPALALTEKSRSWLRFRAANDRPNSVERGADEPAPTLAFGHNPPRWLVNTGRDWKEGGPREDAQTFDATERPAPSVDGKGRWHVEQSWPHHRPSPTIVANRRSKDGPLVGRQLPEGEGENIGGQDWKDGPPEHQRESAPRDPDWPAKRPATTVAGDPRLAQPGHKNEEAMPGCPGRMEGAIRVSLAEALVLQSFPPDYPIQGNKTMQFRQVGDAVPPGLAFAVLEEAIR